MSRLSALISGVGVVSAAGGDKASTLASLREGKRNFSTKQPFDTTVSAPTFQVGAELPQLPGRMNASRTLRLAMRAVGEALGEAGLKRFEPGTRVGVCLGTTVGCQLNSVPFYAAFRRGDAPDLDPVYNFLSTNLAKAVGELVGAKGSRMTVVNACSSGTDAIGVAAGWIAAGLCDVAIAGGADELYIVPLSGFWSLGVMSGEPCAPFDRDRAGLNLGEGAGVLILESEEHLRLRGGKADFEIAGFSSACDAHHLTAPHPEGRGLDAAVRTAMDQGGVSASDVAFINAHGTATQDNDRAEGKVIARLFGTSVPFLSTKGYTGHTLGAAGGLEAAFTLLGLREGWIPASAGFAVTSEDIPVAPVKRVTEISGRYALSTSLAFGGNNAAVLIGRRA
jgi:3-oxoacyl-(acyl-carrier-protein) synthase